MTDLATQTPLEIDTQIAALWNQVYDLVLPKQYAYDSVMRTAGSKRLYGRGGGHWSMSIDEAIEAVQAISEDESAPGYRRDEAAQALARYEDIVSQVEALHDQITVLNAEYYRRPWTRAYLVTDGHVHSSMECSTCHHGEYRTQFTWLVEFAGRTEAEVIEAAAERACTVCYPNAPVATAGPSTLMTPDERTREEKRQDAAKAKEERLAKKIAKGLTEDGSEFVVSYPTMQHRYLPNPADGGRTRIREEYLGERKEYFKTEQAAVQWLVQYTIWDAGRTDEKAPAFAAIKDAVAAKHKMTPAEVDAMIDAKIAAKKKRDERG